MLEAFTKCFQVFQLHYFKLHYYHQKLNVRVEARVTYDLGTQEIENFKEGVKIECRYGLVRSFHCAIKDLANALKAQQNQLLNFPFNPSLPNFVNCLKILSEGLSKKTKFTSTSRLDTLRFSILEIFSIFKVPSVLKTDHSEQWRCEKQLHFKFFKKSCSVLSIQFQNWQ